MQIIVYHSKARKTMCGMGTFCLIGMISLQLTIQNGDLEYIDIGVNTVANNVVEIPGAPSDSMWIPVIIGHVSTGACLESISRDGRWRIYSTASQQVTVRFYNRPWLPR